MKLFVKTITILSIITSGALYSAEMRKTGGSAQSRNQELAHAQRLAQEQRKKEAAAGKRQSPYMMWLDFVLSKPQPVLNQPKPERAFSSETFKNYFESTGNNYTEVFSLDANMSNFEAVQWPTGEKNNDGKKQ